MSDTPVIELRSLELRARALRQAELRRIGTAFGGWLRRLLNLRPATRTV